MTTAKIPLSLAEDVGRLLYEHHFPDGPKWIDYETPTRDHDDCRTLADKILRKIFDSPGKYVTTEKRILELAIDRMTWEEINAYHQELQRGQDVTEDAGGYFLRAIRRLFGLGTTKESVETYKSATMKMVERLYE